MTKLLWIRRRATRLLQFHTFPVGPRSMAIKWCVIAAREDWEAFHPGK